MTGWRATRHPGYWVNADGLARGPRGFILRQKLRGKGYPSITVSGNRVAYVHILACEAFHGPRPTPTHQVGHRNGAPQDNRSDNLRWVTPAENSADSRRHGTYRLRPGGAAEGNGNARLTWPIVEAIRAEAAAGATQASLALKYKIGKSQAHNIVTGKQWRSTKAA